MYGQTGSCTLATIAVTVVFSCTGFARPELEERCVFDPQRILAWKQYYRLLTSGFLHADWRHLGLNMVSLYFFGPSIEFALGPEQFLLIYLGSIVGGDLLSLYIHRHHEYRAYGASGGVCGIIFAHILLWPGSSVGIFVLPVSVPGWLYVILFMAGSFYAMKAGRDNVGHDAHLGGAIIGLLLAAALCPEAVRQNWQIFLLVFVGALALLVYLWLNPLLLPSIAVPSLRWARKRQVPKLSSYRQLEKDLDAVLEKVAETGIDSLNEKERALLNEFSSKYQRRSESKKPESGLAI
jgi:membrane associated rhomboid family serine protease